MSMRVNQSESAITSSSSQKSDRNTIRNQNEQWFQNKRTSEKEKQLRITKFQALKKIYTNKKEYNAALEQAMADGTYNPDAPQFIFADKSTVKNYQKLEQAMGQKIVNEDGTINTAAYKKAMLLISGDLDIDAEELKNATNKYGLSLSKSKLEKLAKPLGITMQSTNSSIYSRQSKEAEEMARIRLENKFINNNRDNKIKTLYIAIRVTAQKKGVPNTQLVKMLITTLPEVTFDNMILVLRKLEQLPDKNDANYII